MRMVRADGNEVRVPITSLATNFEDNYFDIFTLAVKLYANVRLMKVASAKGLIAFTYYYFVFV